VYDLGCGTGAIARVVLAEMPGMQVHAVDLASAHVDAARQSLHGWGVTTVVGDVLADPTTWAAPGARRGDAAVVMNPPYSYAREFVDAGLQVADTVVALLRVNWVASRKRKEWHRLHPSDLHVLDKRPSFTGDGKTDATEYAWFVWAPFTNSRWSILDVDYPKKPRAKKCSGGSPTP